MGAAAAPLLVREVRQRIGSFRVPEVEECTLLELVKTVSEITDDDAEVVATVVYMLRVGSVRLTGNFQGEPISDFDDAVGD